MLTSKLPLKATKAALWPQPSRGVAATAPAAGALLDALKRALGYSEADILRSNVYKQAERSAREVLAEQMRGGGRGADASETAGTDTMTSNMTGQRSWKSENADLLEEREEVGRDLGGKG